MTIFAPVPAWSPLPISAHKSPLIITQMTKLHLVSHTAAGVLLSNIFPPHSLPYIYHLTNETFLNISPRKYNKRESIQWAKGMHLETISRATTATELLLRLFLSYFEGSVFMDISGGLWRVWDRLLLRLNGFLPLKKGQGCSSSSVWTWLISARSEEPFKLIIMT